MSFLKELGASIGIGNLNVGVDCEKVAHHGEPIRGVATLSGGKVAQIVNGLEVRLVRSWEVWDEERNRYEPRSEVIHRRPAQFQAQVQPGAVYTANFLLDIP